MRTFAAGDELGGYKIVSLLRQEDAGGVYVAADPVGHRLRLRVLSEVLLAEPFLRVRALEDLAKLQALQHPGVAHFVAWQEKDPAFYGVSDPGGATLEAIVNQARALDERELAWLGIGVAQALGALHAAGIPHGDLSPGNVAITADGPVVIDLGWGPRLKAASNKAIQSRDVDALSDLLRYAADAPGRTHLPGRASSPLAGEVAERLARAIASAPDGAAAAQRLIEAAGELGLGDAPPTLAALIEQAGGQATPARASGAGRLFATGTEEDETDVGAADDGSDTGVIPRAATAVAAPGPAGGDEDEDEVRSPLLKRETPPAVERPVPPPPAASPPTGDDGDEVTRAPAAVTSGAASPLAAAEPQAVSEPAVAPPRTAPEPPAPGVAQEPAPPASPELRPAPDPAPVPAPISAPPAASGSGAGSPGSGSQPAIPGAMVSAPPPSGERGSGTIDALPPPLFGKAGARVTAEPAPAETPAPSAGGSGGRALVAAGLVLVALGIGYALGRGPAPAPGLNGDAVAVEAHVRELLGAGKSDEARQALLVASQRGVRTDPQLVLQVAESALAHQLAAERDVNRRRAEEEEAARRRAADHAQELTREGQLALEAEQPAAARERFLAALQSDPSNQEAAAGLERASQGASQAAPAPTPEPVPEAPVDPNAGEAWRRQRIDARLAAGQAALGQGDLTGAEEAFREVLALSPRQADALRGLAELERAHDDAAQRAAERTADQLVERGLAALADGRSGLDPLLDALQALDQALQVVPAHPAARRERQRLVARLQLLVEERRDEDDQQLLTGDWTGDQWLDVIELDRVLIDRGLPGGVRFVPTRAFRALRDEVRGLADGRYRVLIRVRSQVSRPHVDTPSPDVKVQATALEVALEDKQARTCTPWERIPLEGGPHYRTVRVDARGRIVEPFTSAHGLDVPRVVLRVSDTVHRLIAQAGKKNGG